MKQMKLIINIYRILVITLSFFIVFFFFLYIDKDCIKVENKRIVNPNYVFLGDSITDFYDLNKYYKNLPVVNSGINGNRVDDILNNLNERVYRYNPSKLFILIGINDLLYENHDDEISPKIEEIVKKVKKKLPYCDIYVESILPMNNDWYVYVEKDDIQNQNKKIKELCKKNNVIYIDLYSNFIDENYKLDGKYTNDGLHPNEQGYEKMTNILKKYL